MATEQTGFYTEILRAHLGSSIEALEVKPMPGGCINNARRVSTANGDFFVKWNKDVPVDVFAKEAQGLALLRQQNIVQVPQVIGYGQTEGHVPYLLLEYIHSGKRKPDFWHNLGEKFAALHQVSNETFGLATHNYIGSLPQDNTPTDDWATFFIEKRLKTQLRIATEKKLISTALNDHFEALFSVLPVFLKPARPSLVHGDLWNGNVMTGSDGYACLMDPAVHFAHREIEIAFTKLFGGFDDDFYTAYTQALPLEKGFERRAELYNLYPLLVHVNLFGKEYLKPIESIAKRFI